MHYSSHALNFMVGPAPIEVKFDDILIYGMQFILNSPDCKRVEPMVELQASHSWKACGKNY